MEKGLAVRILKLLIIIEAFTIINPYFPIN
jgi:hypothetical protein